MKKGFTLAEIIIVFVILGVISLMVMQTLFSPRPSKEKIMFKKAYFLTERIVSELTNDEDYYRNNSTGGILSDLDEVPYNNMEFKGNSKFCNLFATKLNTMGTISCEASAPTLTDATVPTGNFKTTDGVVWLVPITDFASDTKPYTIHVDVNGDDKPNCLAGNTNCDMPDRFSINLYSSGRINVTGSIEEKYLKSEKIN